MAYEKMSEDHLIGHYQVSQQKVLHYVSSHPFG